MADNNLFSGQILVSPQWPARCPAARSSPHILLIPSSGHRSPETPAGAARLQTSSVETLSESHSGPAARPMCQQSVLQDAVIFCKKRVLRAGLAGLKEVTTA